MLQLFSVNPHFIIIMFLYLCVSSQLQKKKKIIPGRYCFAEEENYHLRLKNGVNI